MLGGAGHQQRDQPALYSSCIRKERKIHSVPLSSKTSNCHHQGSVCRISFPQVSSCLPAASVLTPNMAEKHRSVNGDNEPTTEIQGMVPGPQPTQESAQYLRTTWWRRVLGLESRLCHLVAAHVTASYLTSPTLLFLRLRNRCTRNSQLIGWLGEFIRRMHALC